MNTPVRGRTSSLESGQTSPPDAACHPGDALALERAARTRAEAAVFMRDRILSILSHDLRGPLNAIQTWAHVLEHRLGTEDATLLRALGGIRTGVDQQVKLIEDFVDVIRVATRHLSLQRQPQPPGPILRSVLENLRATTVSGAQAITLAPAEHAAEPIASLDAERLWQALWTLFAHALRSAQTGQPIEASETVADGAWLLAVVYTPMPADQHANNRPDLIGAVAPQPPLYGHDGVDVVLSLPARVAEAHDGKFCVETLGNGKVRMSLRVPLAGAVTA